MSIIAANLKRVQETIWAACERAGRNPSEVTLVVVSKQRSPQEILMAAEAGAQHFGENRVEEAEIKLPEIRIISGLSLTWHMIGHIQSRKTLKVLELFDIAHSIGSVKLAEKFSRLADVQKPFDVLLQMNISGEDTKSGFTAVNWETEKATRAQLWQQVAYVLKLPGLRVRGLMTMAPIVTNMEQTRPIFKDLATLRDVLSESFGLPLPDLSMGMTDDYPVAVEEGATMVRIGRAIFGEWN